MALAPWTFLISPIAAIVEKLIPDKAAAAAATAQLQQMALQGQLQEELAQIQALTTAQSDINKVEAASPNWFVAGARPAILWICAVALAMVLIIGPLFTWATMLAGHPTPFPTLDSNLLMTLLFGMLGLGGYRTVEKIKGVANIH
jgi:hypothetical protein